MHYDLINFSLKGTELNPKILAIFSVYNEKKYSGQEMADVFFQVLFNFENASMCHNDSSHHELDTYVECFVIQKFQKW